MFKEQKGVTLVALVITIIVLLILAAVSISMIAGDNGILTKATNASKESSLSDAKTTIITKAGDFLATYYDVKYAKKSGGSDETITENTAGDYIARKLKDEGGTGKGVLIDAYAKNVTLNIAPKDTTLNNYKLTITYSGTSENAVKVGYLYEDGSIKWD